MSQKKNFILPTSESNNLDNNLSSPKKSLNSNLYSYHSTLNNNKQLFNHQKHGLTLNNINNNESDGTILSNTNNTKSLMQTTPLGRFNLHNHEQVV